MTLCALLLAAATAVAGAPAPGSTNPVFTARLYPVSAQAHRMDLPDGKSVLLDCKRNEQGVWTWFSRDNAWYGETVPMNPKLQRVDIFRRRWTKGEKDPKILGAYTFFIDSRVEGSLGADAPHGGQLIHYEENGKPVDPPMGDPQFKETLGELIPERQARSLEKGGRGDLWQQDEKRLRLWFANPNSAGLLFAQLGLLLAILVPWLWQKGRAWGVGGAGLFAGTVYGLLRTGSRGALLAFVIGLGCLLLPHLRRLVSKKGVLIVGLVIAVLGGAIWMSGQGSRLAGTFTKVDAGNALRLKVAKAAVQMFADAPQGWQGGEVPGRNACLNWYLFDENRTIRTHLMTLAEVGWIRGFALVLFWTLMLGLGILALRHRQAAPLAFWASFCLAGGLNPVYVEASLWVLPVAVLLLSPFPGVRFDRRCVLGLSVSCVFVSLAVVGGLVWTGRSLARQTSIPVRAVGKATFVNGDSPSTWVVEDQYVLGGFGFPGREILDYYTHHPETPALAYVYEIADLPAEVETLILPGRAAEAYLKACEEAGKPPVVANRTVFLTPSVGPDRVPEALREATEVVWVAGRYAALRECAGYFGEPPKAWRTVFGTRAVSHFNRRPWVTILGGCEAYVPGWMTYVR